jgi:uncharacterized protein YpiB (UPF0302 family)
MKNFYLNPPPHPEVNYLDSLFAELLLDQALLQFKREKILKEIDQALFNQDKDLFLQLSEELKQMNEQ